MLITNANVFTGDGQVFHPGYVLTWGTKIVAVGSMADLPKATGQVVVDATGKTLLPGLIDGHCHLGLWEDSLGFAGADGNEATNPVTPNLQVTDGINPRDNYFRESLESGVTTVAVTPGSTNVIGGSIAAIKTHGNRMDDMILRQNIGMKMALGENPKRTYHSRKETPTTRMAEAALIREAFHQAKAYGLAKETNHQPAYDARLEALLPVLAGTVKVHIHAHRADDMFTAMRIAKEWNLSYLLVHCTEGHLIADALAEANAEVIIGPVMTDRSKAELANATLKNGAILEQHGIDPAICSDHPETPLPYLNLYAGLCVREGMSYQKAIEAITLRPAKLLGIDDLVGSIAPGKEADLVLFDGDPLAISTKVAWVMVAGKMVFQRE